VTARTPTVKWAGWIEATDTEYDDGYDDCNKYQCAYTTIAIMAPTVSVLATKSHDHNSQLSTMNKSQLLTASNADNTITRAESCV